jgi:hypothetical protein
VGCAPPPPRIRRIEHLSGEIGTDDVVTELGEQLQVSRSTAADIEACRRRKDRVSLARKGQ